jgi:hypothetical protein
MISTLLLCKSCAASNLVELNAELCIHFPGLKGLEVEPTYAIPKLRVCLYCGSIQSDLSAKELDHVRKGAARFEAIREAGNE